jgi:hypothetical protein
MEKIKLEQFSDEPEDSEDILTEQIRKKAFHDGVPAEKFWNQKAKFLKEVQQRYSEEHYSAEWQNL